MDERAGELEAPLHAARQLPGPTATDVPQVEQLEDLARPLRRRKNSIPNSEATKSTFSRTVRSG